MAVETGASLVVAEALTAEETGAAVREAETVTMVVAIGKQQWK